MQRVVKLKLQASPAQKAILRDTVAHCTACFNTVATVAWEALDQWRQAAPRNLLPSALPVINTATAKIWADQSRRRRSTVT